ncbi:MAG: hypothetical protein ACTHOD_07225 [Motilibacteraceae bacterium]
MDAAGYCSALKHLTWGYPVHRSRSIAASLPAVATAVVAAVALAAPAAAAVAPSSSDARRAQQDLSTYCTYAAASTGIRSEHPRWYGSLCQGAGTQAEAAALRTCYTAVADRLAVSSSCLADVRAGAVWSRLDAVESGSASAAATRAVVPRWHRPGLPALRGLHRQHRAAPVLVAP